MSRRKWTAAEVALLKCRYGTCPAEEIAAELRRPLHQVYNAANRHGLATRQRGLPEEFDEILRVFHDYGWSDSEIADFWCLSGHIIDRRTICDHRKRLRLPSNAFSERRRRRVAEKTREQCRRAGVGSLAEVRRQAFQRFARARGWPDDLAPRCVQMLDAMYEQGPMTRRQLAAAIGMPWKGSRKSLVGNGPGGSYLATLMRRGLVVAQKRAVKQPGKGKGKSVNLYLIPLHVKRGLQHGTQTCAGTARQPREN